MAFDPEAFREAHPQFSDPVTWSDERLNNLYQTATCFVWPCKWVGMRAHCQAQALDLMVGHLATLQQQALDGCGGSSGIQTGASIDRVSVTLQAPPAASGWQHWLSTTPDGLMLWALLSTLSRGGRYIGAVPERAGFRKGGGVF